MGALLDRLSDDLKDAMRAGDAVRRDEIRGLLAALKTERQAKLTRHLERRGLLLRGDDARLTPQQQAEAERLRAETDLTDDEEIGVLQQRVKQHRQSIEGFQKGHRADLVAVEEAQLAVVQRYLPRQVGDAELDEAIRTAVRDAGAQGPRDQGKVMGLLSQRLRGRADMKDVSARVQAILTPSV